MSVKIYHNPRCSKSRQTKALLDERGVSYETVLYLEHPPTTDELEQIVKALGLTSAREMIRKGEDAYTDLGLSAVNDEEALITAMSEHPKLIERPIVVCNARAAIGRPPESVLNILDR